jgi:hypothetical protein
MMATPPVVLSADVPVEPVLVDVEVEPVVLVVEPALALAAGERLLVEVAPSEEVEVEPLVVPVVLPVVLDALLGVVAPLVAVQAAVLAPAPVLAAGAALMEVAGLADVAGAALARADVVVLAGALDVLAVPPPQAARTSKAPVAAGRRSLVMNFSDAMYAMMSPP